MSVKQSGPRIVGLAIVLAGLGCGSTISPSEDQLRAAEQRWADTGPASYSMVITRSSLVGTSFAAKVTVANGLVTDRTFLDPDGNPTVPVPASQVADYPDVPGLFTLVRRAFDEAQSANVSFDATYGFPNSIVINYDRVTIEDDITIAVTQFAPAT
ncbi:MAG: DUF6174 domain-containing protein [Gemmatimonadales bacterium]